MATTSGSKSLSAQAVIFLVRSLQNVAIPHLLGRYEETNATLIEVSLAIVRASEHPYAEFEKKIILL
jgi:hypothetical protein